MEDIPPFPPHTPNTTCCLLTPVYRGSALSVASLAVSSVVSSVRVRLGNTVTRKRWRSTTSHPSHQPSHDLNYIRESRGSDVIIEPQPCCSTQDGVHTKHAHNTSTHEKHLPSILATDGRLKSRQYSWLAGGY